MNPLFKTIFCLGVAAVIVVGATIDLVDHVSREARNLPSADEIASELRDGTRDRDTKVLDRKGAKIGTLDHGRRWHVSIDQLPQHVIAAFTSAEDKDFFRHPGIDPISVLRAAAANLRSRSTQQGGSTITQQVARILFLDRSKTLSRKTREAVLALAIEDKLTKEEILEIYLNRVFLGNGSWGIEAAARNYFGKSAVDLDVGEAAMLAGLPKAPSRLAPDRHMDRAMQRRRVVLRRMKEDGHLTPSAAARWARTPVSLASRPETEPRESGWFLSEVRRELRQRFESNDLGSAGIKVRTTLDAGLQSSAAAATRQALRSVNALRKSASIRSDGPVEAALVALNATTGAVLAMQGGGDFADTQYNRAIRSRRAIGGLTDVFLTSAALEQGFDLLTNFSPMLSDPITLLGASRNRDSAERAVILQRIGSGTLNAFGKAGGVDLGTTSMALAQGYGVASPLALARFVGSILNGGILPPVRMISRLESAAKELRYSEPEPGKRVMQEDTAWIVRETFFQAKGAAGSLASLAGSSPDLHNSWHIGVSGQLVTVVWIGSEFGDAKLGPDAPAVEKLAEDMWNEFSSRLPPGLRQPLKSQAPANVAFGITELGESVPTIIR